MNEKGEKESIAYTEFEYLPDSNTGPSSSLNLIANRRSVIPRVIGILEIIFACLGFLFSCSMAIGPIETLERQEISWSDLGPFGTWVIVCLAFSIAVFGIHLTAGILSVSYQRLATRFTIVYGISALLLIIADIAISVNSYSEIEYLIGFDELVGPRIGIGIFGIPWPIVALIFMNLRTARQSCGRPDDRLVAQLFH